MQFGKRLQRNKLTRWIWKYAKLQNHVYLVASLYDDYIMVIGNTFICTNCAIVFPDTSEGGQEAAFQHIEKAHAKVVTPYAGD